MFKLKSIILMTLLIVSAKSFGQDLDILLKCDPFWGSNNGNVVPGASFPWGMVKLAPDVDLIDTPTSGYRDGARIAGFSHNHANGVGGAPRYGNIMLIPQSDSLDIKGIRKYEKQNEEGHPGYYAVTLKHLNNDIRSELTAMPKVGFHRYKYSKSYNVDSKPKPYLVIDASHANKRLKNGKPQTYCSDGTLTFVNDSIIEGESHFIGGWGGDNPYTIYYCITFKTPFDEYGVFQNGTSIPGQTTVSFSQNEARDGRFGGFVSFDESNPLIECKVGISYKDIQSARKNLVDVSSIGFDEALTAAQNEWASLFSRVKVKGNNLNAQKNFYSALRSAMLMPSDVTGDVEEWTGDHFWDFYCIWDTYRTVSPLYTLLFPEMQRRIIRCMLDIYEKRGYLPDAWIGGDYATVQGGSNSDVVLADAVVKQLGGFDYNKALEATLKNAEVQADDPFRKGRFADEYNRLGYVRGETIKNSVSRSLEYAYNDYCIAAIALACENPMIYDRMGRKSMEIFNLFNPEQKMFWGKDSLGNWKDDFNPQIIRPDSWNDPYFYEGGSMIYSTYVPHDMAGLVKKFGGKNEFKTYLDSIFTSGTFKMENEFEFLVPYLYNYIGDYASTARRVTDVMREKYLPGRNGIPGQDDAGAMSAWYVFSAIGLMPVAGQDLYLIGSPQFEETEISLEGDKKLIIKANNLTNRNIYIVSAKFNGKPIDRTWIRHTELKNGGVLEFEMSSIPGEWGNRTLPPSLSETLQPRAMNEHEAQKQAENLLNQMSLDEKISMISGHNSFYVKGTERLGIPALYMSDASGGVHIRPEIDSNLEKSVSFPAPVALAATWNPMLSFNMAKAIGEECRYGNIDILLGPGMNIYRMSQNGRNFEYFGEDPYLASKITESYVVGMQSTGTMATLKHFVCNNNEHHRRLSNALVSRRALNEIYLPAFKAGIDAGVACVMTSYNMVNGEYTAESYELVSDVLRNQLGFNGLVMSDWRSVYDPVKSIKSGLDLEMPGDYADWLKQLGDTPFTHLKHEAKGLLNNGLIDEGEINRMVASILKTSLTMGVYEKEKVANKTTIDFESHEKVALDVARESIVLLKNRDKLLPLAPSEMVGKKILLTGLFLDTIPSGGGSAYVEGYDNITISEALKSEFDKSINVTHNPTDHEIINSDYIILSIGTFDREGIDRSFSLPDSIENMVKRIVDLNPNTIVTVSSGGGIRMSDWIEKCGAALYAWFPGQSGNVALAEIISGVTVPSGHLPFSIEREFSDSPGYGYKRDDESFDMPWQDEYSFKFPVNNIDYSEDVFVGYRWYEAKKIRPLFAFGHGLSYTDFDYSDLRLPGSFDGDMITVSCMVTNLGDTGAKETVQLYIGDDKASVKRPVKELKGFKKIYLAPGERKLVNFDITRDDLSFFDPKTNSWRFEPGQFSIHIGNSSDNITLKGKFKLKI